VFAEIPYGDYYEYSFTTYASMSEPRGVTGDAFGNVYISEGYRYSNVHQVTKYSPNGEVLARWGTKGSADGQFLYPVVGAVDSSGNVYVCDWGNNRIQKFDSKGNFIAKWHNVGSGEGQFDVPVAMAIDSNDNIYIADANNHRVQKVDTDGNYITQFGGYGTAEGQIITPRDIAVDDEGNVYVTSTANNRIQKFDTNGKFLQVIGTAGTGEDQYNLPHGIDVDHNGHILVSDRRKHRILQYDKKGNLIGKFSGGIRDPRELGTDAFGNVYILCPDPDDKVYKLTRELNDSGAIAFDKEWLEVGYGGKDDGSHVTGQVTFPRICPNGSTVSWYTHETEHVMRNGVIWEKNEIGFDGFDAHVYAFLAKGSESLRKDFDFTIVNAPSSDARLFDMTFITNGMRIYFNPLSEDMELSLGNIDTPVKLDFTTMNHLYGQTSIKMTFNGENLSFGEDLNLTSGFNLLIIEVTAEDGVTKKIYRVDIYD